MGRAKGSDADDSLLAAAAQLERATSGALRHIAVDALSLGVGERLPKGDSYRQASAVGSGTVQQAFTILASAGALETVSRGHLGRQIVKVREDRLWRLADLDPVRLILPPRGPIEVRAMAEFAADVLGRRNIPFRMQHMRGARDRVAAVVAGDADAAVVSSGGSEELMGTPGDLQLGAIQHSHGTYYAPGRLLVLSRQEIPEAARCRVAIDYTSWDQARLTECEFPKHRGYEYVEIDFPRVPVEILRGAVDVGIWHEMQTLISPRLAGLEVSEPREVATHELLARSSAAVFVYSTRRPELRVALDAMRETSFSARVENLMAALGTNPDLFDFAWSV